MKLVWKLALVLMAMGACTAARAEPPARNLFGAQSSPAALASQSIGFYSRGCVAGAVAMPKDGPAWQMMRLSRNRAWGHPAMVEFLQKFAADAASQDGWRGLLLGDISQPRGGPMLSGHASHQIGLDADIYFTEMPSRRLSDAERETLQPQSLIDTRTLRVDERYWRPEHLKLLRRAASSPMVQRIFVHPGIKQKLCSSVRGDRGWLNKVRPTYGHDYHFHIRLFCQPGSGQCEKQEATGTGDGCDNLDWWFNVALQPPPPDAKPYKPKPPLQMADLPNACRTVLAAGGGAGIAAAAPVAQSYFPVPERLPMPTMRPVN
ncbi:penicillin-insensitive murein endopeptidase [Aureimonas fodinaquatilis]|uniref:Penicillin-insensitive murein endopeptidase n=2 Tax=Aureimonas fodinaquatilis TaxID=2565783 RepID=A0A5B0E4I7_9HYPH|nr:penicillin-insensitive murein endopeptidase [Aureimonas fodinaquatilis]